MKQPELSEASLEELCIEIKEAAGDRPLTIKPTLLIAPPLQFFLPGASMALWSMPHDATRWDDGVPLYSESHLDVRMKRWGFLPGRSRSHSRKLYREWTAGPHDWNENTCVCQRCRATQEQLEDNLVGERCMR